VPYFPIRPDDEGPSFFEFLTRHHPDLLPSARWAQACSPSWPDDPRAKVPPPLHGTTVLALKYDAGVVIAGDRRATEGFQIAGRQMDKVFKIDEHSAMAIAGTAGPAIEMAKLFQTELEHYEKLEGMQLSVEGKANKLGQMVKANLPMVFQGLIVIPIYVGYDHRRKDGRIFKYDITGGRYEESDYHAIGSGGKDARNTIRERYRKHLPQEEALKIAMLALYNAAEEDVATGGPDLIRGIYPSAKVVSSVGIVDIEDHHIKGIYTALIEERGKGV
jgi:proteasome beta subunit